jgi:hypothetical protein
MGENPRKIHRITGRNVRRKWQTECLSKRDMSAPLDLFADDVIRTAYTRLLPLTLVAGIVAVLCRAIVEKLVSVAIAAFRRKGVRAFVDRLGSAVTRFRSESAAPHQVQPAHMPSETIESVTGELRAPR